MAEQLHASTGIKQGSWEASSEKFAECWWTVQDLMKLLGS